jgi:Protein of unknown function (DUF3551)
MRRLLAISAFLLAISATPSMARDYPWCMRAPSTVGNPQCMFTSFSQCQASISGQGGDCMQNPAMMAYGYDQSRAPRSRRARDGWRGNDGWNDGGWDNRRW